MNVQTSSKIGRPQAGEFATYYQKYVELVPDGDIMEFLNETNKATVTLLESVSEEGSLFRYSPGKWSIKELIGHLSDTERIFSYRALRFARGDSTELAGFDQDDYIGAADFDSIKFSAIVEDFIAVRRASLTLYSNLPIDAFKRTGVASGASVTVRALAYMTAGHELHHVNILKSRYLAG